MMPFSHFGRWSLAAALALPALPAAADVFTVGHVAGCTHVSIQAALNAAAANGPGEDEVRVHFGEYTQQQLLVANQSVALSGGWNGCGPAAAPIGFTALIGGFEAGVPGTNAVIRIMSGGEDRTVTLERLEIRDGHGGLDGNGGGIDAQGAVRVVLRNVDVLDNQAHGNGGGIALHGNGLGAVLELHAGVRIAGNRASQAGGGIYLNQAAARIRSDRTEIAFNSATRGGGLAAAGGSVTIGSVGEPASQADATGARIIENSAQRGGGVHLDAQALFNANELELSFNHATEMGGGLYATGAAQVRLQRDYSDAAAVQCAGATCARIVGNQAGNGCPGTRGDGGGLYLEADTRAFLRQVALVDNCAWGSPGLISWGVQLELEGVLVAGNRLRWREGNNATGRRVINHASAAGSGPATTRVAFVTFAHNVEVDDQGGTIAADAMTRLSTSGRWQYAVDAVASADPLPFSGELGSYGRCNRVGLPLEAFVDAAQGDYRPHGEGPLVDACAAEPAVHAYRDPLLTPRCLDHGRPDQGGACDIGAYERTRTVPSDRLFADAFE